MPFPSLKSAHPTLSMKSAPKDEGTDAKETLREVTETEASSKQPAMGETFKQSEVNQKK